MTTEFLRIFKKFNIEEVRDHLLIAGHLVGDCAACRALGIDVLNAHKCPECQTAFKYLTSRRLELHPGERFQFAIRMTEKRPDLILVDYTDYTKAMGQKKARDFFG